MHSFNVLTTPNQDGCQHQTELQDEVCEHELGRGAFGLFAEFI